jgi:hypothetical protein
MSIPAPSGSFRSNLDEKSISKQIFDNAKKCWQRSATWTRNGIFVSNRIELDGVVITAADVQYPDRYLHTILRIVVSDTSGGSDIQIFESKLSGKDLGFASDVNRWLTGDWSCRSLNF